MRKTTAFIIFLVIILLSAQVCFADGSDEGLVGNYNGTYEMTEVDIGNINAYLKSIDAGYEYDNVTPKDYYKGNAEIKIKDDGSGGKTVEYIEDGHNFEVKEFSIDGENLHITLQPDYYGFDEEYKVSGFADLYFSDNKEELSGTFTIYLPNGSCESSGTVSLSRSGGLIDKIGDIVGQGGQKDGEDVAVTDILFKSINISMEQGESHKLKATIFPREATNKGVEYTTSDSSVVSVDGEGNIIAISGGQASIKAASAENPDIFDMCRVVVFVKEPDEADRERQETGMTIFKDNPGEFVETPPEAEKNIDEIRKTAEVNTDLETVREIRTDKDNLQKVKLVKRESLVQQELEEKGSQAGKGSVEYIRESLRLNRKPMAAAVDVLASKIKTPSFLKDFIKEKIDSNIKGLDETREKTEDEKREQLYETFSNEKKHSVFTTIKEKLTNNPIVNAFSRVLDKITAEKTKVVTDNIVDEHEEIADRVNSRIESGMTREQAVGAVRSEFSNEVISDRELAGQDKAKTLWQKITYMFGGGRKGLNGISSKREYYNDSDRFDKHIELMDKNLEFAK